MVYGVDCGLGEKYQQEEKRKAIGPAVVRSHRLALVSLPFWRRNRTPT